MGEKLIVSRKSPYLRGQVIEKTVVTGMAPMQMMKVKLDTGDTIYASYYPSRFNSNPNERDHILIKKEYGDFRVLAKDPNLH